MELVANEGIDAHEVTSTFGVTLVSGDSPEDIKKLEHQVVAQLKLSGTIIKIGVEDNNPEPSIWLWTDDMGEVTYMSPCEASTLIAGIQLAVHEAMGTN